MKTESIIAIIGAVASVITLIAVQIRNLKVKEVDCTWYGFHMKRKVSSRISTDDTTLSSQETIPEIKIEK